MNQAGKGEEGENREGRAAAHGKHMSCTKKSLYGCYAYIEGKKGRRMRGLAWRDTEGGRDVRLGRA